MRYEQKKPEKYEEAEKAKEEEEEASSKSKQRGRLKNDCTGHRTEQCPLNSKFNVDDAVYKDEITCGSADKKWFYIEIGEI